MVGQAPVRRTGTPSPPSPTAGVPGVVVSAEVGSEKIERALAAGAREYLTKPLDMARFRAVVDSMLSKVPSRR